MKLYHGTYLDELIKIIKDEKLDNTKVYESTAEFDAIFEKFSGENFTKDALYFTDDIECTRTGYDFEFTVDAESDFIDTNYLYVADFNKREEIMGATTDDERKIRVQEYKDSFIPYKEYIECWNTYDKAHTLREFLYFDCVDVSLEIEEKKEDILDIFDENWNYPQDYKELLGDFYDRDSESELNEIIENIKKLGWRVTKEDDTNVLLQIFSPAGQDFSISIDTENDADTFVDNIYECYDNFDVSYETYLWLDSDGHGKNGAPYDMRDLYNDMEACEQLILKLYNELER